MNKQLFFCLALSVLATAAVTQRAGAYRLTGQTWPQESLGDPVHLTYSYEKLLNGGLVNSRGTPLSESEIRSGVEEALQLWATYAPLHFTEVAQCFCCQPFDDCPRADIRFSHAHLCTGAGGAKAFAFGPPNGLVDFDSEDRWNLIGTNAYPDLLGTAIHELGHVLGLGHSQYSSANMWPEFPRMKGPGTGSLSPDDIAGIQAIYGEGTGSLTPLLPPTASEQHSFDDWASDNGYVPGDVMPQQVIATCSWPAIYHLDGIGQFDWTNRPTTELDLGCNRISSLESGDFDGLKDLVTLSLERNRVSSLESGAFQGLTNLTTLDLSQNAMRRLESGDFDGLGNLTELDLKQNEILRVESGAFHGLTNLTDLDLMDNVIQSIRSGAFEGLAKLTRLDLDGNRIWVIQPNAFQGLANLTRLDLGANELSSIRPGAFNGLTNLTELELEGNRISNIRPGAFSGLPNLTELRLGSNQISRIESGAFDALTNLTSLRLGSEISSIRSVDFSGLAKLTELDLRGNQIRRIESGDFDGRTNLTKLYLSGNQISRIGFGDFDGLTNVTYLSLDGNRISSIESGAFSELPNLTSLNLGDNRVSSVQSGAFDGLPNLESLNLRDNQLSRIESGGFDALTNLTWLWLGGNQISSVESGDFSGLPNLESLDLRDNQLSHIESGGFDGLTNLTWLQLGGNRISSIESGDFSGLPNLTELELESNRISSIEPGDFDGLTNLTTLGLGSNQISSIQSGAFSQLPNLTTLRLDNTPLTELNLTDADFSSLTAFSVGRNLNITSVSLKNTVLNQTSLSRLLDGGRGWVWDFFEVEYTGIGELDGITEMDLSGIDFAEITDLEPLYVMDDLTDLWLAGTRNLDASNLDVLLNNLETIEGIATEGVLHMTKADYDAFNTTGGGLLAAWNGESGHRIQFVVPASSSPADFSGNDALDVKDIRLLAEEIKAGTHDPTFDITQDALVNSEDMTVWVHDHANTWFGDANLDLQFNSGDMLQVFAAGKYETDQTAGWSEGDWNADGFFDSSDMVTAFTDGGYEQGLRTSPVVVPEPVGIAIAGLGLLTFAGLRTARPNCPRKMNFS